ncbi:leucine-rich repeat domain-containing protein [Desulfovibrio sp. PG-178-WT-4]|uniref:Leucine-rich repeat domain-containing protein n=1 Tax=Desulfovibrio porci TaxID=2605782 RepID=A0A6L5XM28_9BACT|nr:leucine-rich repeat domain-containing protein [Desulfovibrio porci]MSS28185.1 leucine-rich repeat domain-containing protein [Desulfovibrio porci]
MSMKTIFCAMLAVGLSVSSAYAEPSVKRSGSTITVKEALTDDGISQAKEFAGKIKTPTFKLENINDADLVKFCQTFPDATSIDIKGKKDELTSIAPVAGLKNLTSFEMDAKSVADMSPLASLKLIKLELTSDAMGPDLKWMAGLTGLKEVEINAGNSLTSFEGFPTLSGNPRVTINGAAPTDLSPLQHLGSSKLELKYCTINDLAPLAKMPNLSELNLYGATVKDFSPLANCEKLKKLTYYAVKEADFSTLGALKQIVELNGGLTKLDNIAFVAELPALRVFDVFAEYVTDYSPLASSKVEKLQIWKMRVPVGDLGSVGKTKTLKELKLWSVDGATNSAALAELTELQKFTITSEYNKKSGDPFDMACAKGWGKLKEMSITGAKIVNAGNMAALTSMEKLTLVKVNVEGEPFSLSGLAKLSNLNSVRINDSQIADFEALAGCSGLTYVEMKGSKGISSLAPLKALPNLKRIIVSKGAFPDAELSGFAQNVKVEQR